MKCSRAACSPFTKNLSELALSANLQQSQHTMNAADEEMEEMLARSLKEVRPSFLFSRQVHVLRQDPALLLSLKALPSGWGHPLRCKHYVQHLS